MSGLLFIIVIIVLAVVLSTSSEKKSNQQAKSLNKNKERKNCLVIEYEYHDQRGEGIEYDNTAYYSQKDAQAAAERFMEDSREFGGGLVDYAIVSGFETIAKDENGNIISRKASPDHRRSYPWD